MTASTDPAPPKKPSRSTANLLQPAPTRSTRIWQASLNNLGVRLNALGRHEEAALHATEEAVTLRRELAAARPDAFNPDLARSLNNLGVKVSSTPSVAVKKH